MGDDKDAFYVVRKGDIIGVYKSFADCQAQAGFYPLDPSISVYKGYGLSKEAESFLLSHGLKQPCFSIGASDVQDGLFGALSVCPFQDAIGSTSSSGCPAQVVMPTNMERNQNHVAAGLKSFSASQQKPVPLKNYADPRHQISAESSSFVANPQSRPVELKNYIQPQQSVPPGCKSCIIEFDGASKGNPGQAGAGAILRATDGSEIWRLREGVGLATNNVAEYRAVILGLRSALEKGFQHVHVRGDSQLVCCQAQHPIMRICLRPGRNAVQERFLPIQGKWKTKNENMANLCKVAKELAKKFVTFAIEQVPREFNSDADTQANRAITLRDGEVEMEVSRSRA